MNPQDSLLLPLANSALSHNIFLKIQQIKQSVGSLTHNHPGYIQPKTGYENKYISTKTVWVVTANGTPCYNCMSQSHYVVALLWHCWPHYSKEDEYRFNIGSSLPNSPTRKHFWQWGWVERHVGGYFSDRVLTRDGQALPSPQCMNMLIIWIYPKELGRSSVPLHFSDKSKMLKPSIY